MGTRVERRGGFIHIFSHVFLGFGWLAVYLLACQIGQVKRGATFEVLRSFVGVFLFPRYFFFFIFSFFIKILAAGHYLRCT